MNSAFIGYEEFCGLRRGLSTFLDLQNSSYPTQPYSIIANYYYNKTLIINSAWLIIIKKILIIDIIDINNLPFMSHLRSLRKEWTITQLSWE